MKINRALGVGVFLLTLWAFLPALRNDFVVYDDENYVRANAHVQQGLTWETLRWAFTTGHTGNWHPVTWLSHALDCQLFGLHPWGHHLTNVLFHAINSVLVFWCLRSLTGAGWRSFWAALLFGVHPIHVESVAWVAERKDVLSAFFGLLTLLAYARYARESKVQSPKSKGFYGLSLLAFACGLMSKPMLVTLPFVLLLLDYWPLTRWQHGRFWHLVVEKVPFLLLATASSIVTFIVQRNCGAMQALSGLSWLDRGGNALVSYCRYLGKLFYPANLAFYPYGELWKMPAVLLAGLLLLGLSVLVFCLRGRRPYLLIGWLWFVGTLVPVMGLVQVGEQAMADRYLYLPSIGLFVAVTWGVCDWTRRRHHLVPALAAVSTVVVLFCITLTRRQLACWKDSETLFRHAIAATENNYMAHHYLGYVLKQQGRFDEAIVQFNEVLKIAPDSIVARTLLGDSLVLSGDREAGIQRLEEAIRLNPADADAHCFLGNAFSLMHRDAEAAGQYVQAIDLNPDFPAAHNNLGMLLWKQGRLPEARDHFKEAVRLRPGSEKFRRNLEAVLAQIAAPEHSTEQ